MPKTKGALSYTNRILGKILREKVVTELELMNVVGRDGNAIGKINHAYQNFVCLNFPIKRRTIDQKFKHGKTQSSGGGVVNHRTRIYYFV